MSSGLSLGPGGERAWKRIRDSWQIEKRLGRQVLVSTSAEARSEVRRRLADLAPELLFLSPGPDAPARIAELAARWSGQDKGLPVAWLEAAEGEDLASSWADALTALNQARQVLGDQGPIFVLLAGPPALAGLVTARAPDLWSVIRRAVDLGEVLSAVGELRPFRWLHLSDLHLKGADWQADAVHDALVRDLPGLLADEPGALDAVFLTGDIAWSGQREQFEAAQALLLALCEALGVDARRQLHIVPGNHDVNRSGIPRIVRNDQQRLLGLSGEDYRAELGEILGNPSDLETYGERLIDYAAFSSRILGPARAVSPAQPWRCDEIEVGGLRVGVAALCSSWACGPDEDKPGRILLGERQVRSALAEIKHCPLRVALLHHPLEWLHEAERTAVSELLRAEFQLVLHGHLHQASSITISNGTSSSVTSAAGSAYAGTDWKHGVQLAQLDPATGQLQVRAFTYSPRDGGYWHADPGVSRGAKDGVLRLSLPPLIAAPAPREASESLVARLCRGARSVYGLAGFMGIAQHGARPPVSLAQLFVPLDLEEKHLDEQKNHSLEQIETELLSPNGVRMVVLGDPGSGKSTLCRYLALRAASAETPRVPLLIPLRDYIRQGLQGRLLAFAAAELSTRLAVRVEEETLEALCRDGQALMLVDGLDEVVEPGQRETVRQALAAFAEAWPKVPVIATSRVVGYDRAPLPGHTFRHLRLSPFNDAQLEAFVGRWMEAAEPADPIARERGRAGLLAALEAEPRAKELARNPLFATLIALVHRAEARLPGERAKLYELVVRTLLETWPAEQGRRFAHLDEGRQREVLERLALRMQEGRQKGSGEGVSIEREALVEALAELLAERELADRSAEARVLARRWVDHLESSTGLFVEQQPGVFAPLHLSVLEYLAARALFTRESREGDEAVAEFVVSHLGRAEWEETLLLMMGSEPTRAGLVDAVFRRLEERHDWWGWSFGVAMLREEVDLRPEQRERVLEGVCRSALKVRRYEWGVVQKRLSDIVRFSRRHGEACESWRDRVLREGAPHLSVGVVALFDPEPTVIVDVRADRDRVVELLLDFGPRGGWERWARQAAPPEMWLRWHEAASVDLSVWRSVGSTAGFPTEAGAATLALLRRVSWLSTAQLAGVERLCREERGNAPMCLPAVARVRRHKTGEVVRVYASAAVCACAESQPVLRTKASPFASDLARWFAVYLGEGFPRDFAMGEHSASLALSFAFDYALMLQLDSEPSPFVLGDFELFFERNVVEYMVFAYPGDFALYIRSKLKRDLSVELMGPRDSKVCADGKSRPGCAPAVAAARSAPRPGLSDIGKGVSPWSDLVSSRTVADSNQGVASLTMVVAVDGYLGLLHGISLADGRPALPPDDSATLAAARVQNRWLYLFFDPIAAKAPDTPQHQALLIALGLTQYQTTWQWPWGEWWARTFAGDPPAHWLPAYFWHLCWQVGEPDIPTHAERAAAALARGRDPAELGAWPELADALARYPLQATPTEVLALYDWGDTSSDAT